MYVITLVFCHWLKDQKWPKQEQPTDRLLHILFTLPSGDCKWLQHVKWRSAKPIKAKNTCMLSTCEYIKYVFVALLLIWEKRPFHDLQMSWRGKVCKAYSKREKQGEKVSHVLLMEESWTKPALCYLLNKITTPLFPPGAFALRLGCPSLSCSPSLSLSPCSLTLGANSCSLINYWCSKAVVGLAGSGFQWVGVGVFNGQCRSQAPLWRASGHPHGSGKDTTLLHVFVSVYVRSQTDTSSYCSIYSS